MGNTLGSLIDFPSLFKEELENPNMNGLVMEYNIKRTNKDKKNLILVEGPDDEFFYQRTNISSLNGNQEYIYAPYSDEEKGKEAVLNAYKTIVADQTLSFDLPRTFFVIDNDWDHLVSGSWESGLSVTLGHSLENYFLSDSNLKKLFSHLNLEEKEAETFISKYHSFCSDTSLFWALKGTIVFAHQNKIPFRYCKKSGFDSIFNFTYRAGDVRFNHSLMDEEIKLMEAGIANSTRLVNYKNKLLRMIIDNPRYVRGHQAFSFLQCYMKGKYDFKFSLRKKKIADFIHECDVTLREIE